MSKSNTIYGVFEEPQTKVQPEKKEFDSFLCISDVDVLLAKWTERNCTNVIVDLEDQFNKVLTGLRLEKLDRGINS